MIEKITIEVLVVAAGIFAGLIKFKSAFNDAINEATQPITASIDKLTLVVEMLRDDIKSHKETIRNLELKVQELATHVHNHNGRLKVLESYHKDRSCDSNV